RDAGQLRKVEFEEFFGTRTRRLPVEAPYAAIGQHSPLHRPIGRHFGATQVAQDLAGWRARIGQIAGIVATAVERTQPALGFKYQRAVAITAIRLAFRARLLLGFRRCEQQEVGHIAATATIGRGLAQEVIMPAKGCEHWQDDFIFGLRLVKGSVSAQAGEDAQHAFAKFDETGFGGPPARRLADAFAQEVAGEKLAVHGAPWQRGRTMLTGARVYGKRGPFQLMDAGSIHGEMVAKGGIEPPTRGFSVPCSTN